jgi:uroporphyrinogen-III synthase
MSPFRLLITKRISPSHLNNLISAGITVIGKEFISITPVRSESKKDEVRKICSRRATTAFTSKNAVRAVSMIASEYQIRPEWKIFSIDGVTLQEVKKYFGASVIAGTAPNSSTLATILLEKSIDREIVFFCGDKRRDEMPDLLRHHGVKVIDMVVYETKPTPEVIHEAVDAVTFFSPSAVDSFFSVNTLEEKVVCFSIGETTTGALNRYTNNKIITSNTPSEQRMVEIILEHVPRGSE